VFVPLLAGRVYVTPSLEQPVHCMVNEWSAMRFAYRPIVAPKYVSPDPPGSGHATPVCCCRKSFT
jgi:hypothetical protein